jgi:flagellar biosynthesis protein FlhA
LLDHLAKDMPKLVEDVVPKAAAARRGPEGAAQSARRGRARCATCAPSSRPLADSAPRSQDPEALTAQVRTALGRAIVQELYPGGAEMQVMSLDPQLERLLLQAVAGGGEGVGIEPGLAETLVRETVAAAQRQEEVGLPMVLLVPGSLRTLLSRFLRRSISQLKVLAHAEVPENRIIKVTSIIGQRA